MHLKIKLLFIASLISLTFSFSLTAVVNCDYDDPFDVQGYITGALLEDEVFDSLWGKYGECSKYKNFLKNVIDYEEFSAIFVGIFENITSSYLVCRNYGIFARRTENKQNLIIKCEAELNNSKVFIAKAPYDCFDPNNKEIFSKGYQNTNIKLKKRWNSLNDCTKLEEFLIFEKKLFDSLNENNNAPECQLKGIKSGYILGIEEVKYNCSK